MKEYYIHLYNKLVELTRNKELYINFKSQDVFSDRLTFLLIHLAFFFKVFKNLKTANNLFLWGSAKGKTWSIVKKHPQEPQDPPRIFCAAAGHVALPPAPSAEPGFRVAAAHATPAPPFSMIPAPSRGTFGRDGRLKYPTDGEEIWVRICTAGW